MFPYSCTYFVLRIVCIMMGMQVVKVMIRKFNAAWKGIVCAKLACAESGFWEMK